MCSASRVAPPVPASSLPVITATSSVPAGSEGASRRASSTTETQAGTVVFRGKGHGHGVGMCQNGAAAMARDGKTARQILAHYYPDATVR